MKKELDMALVRDFPNLYRDRYANMMSTCMCWGFPGDGWEPLIRRLSEKLEAAILKLKSDHPEISSENLPCALQVKEKFGTLRFYMTTETNEMDEWISQAEEESAHTCEECGNPGTTRGGGWLVTLCDNCDKERK